MVDLTNESPCENCVMDPDDTCDCLVFGCFLDTTHKDLVLAGCPNPDEVMAYIGRCRVDVAGGCSS